MNNINIENIFGITKPTYKPLDISSLHYPIDKKITYVDFSVENLINEDLEKKEKAINEYKKIFNLVLKKIKENNKIGIKDIIYEVPVTIFLVPEYDSYKCLQFIEVRLRKYQLNTLIISDNKIFISWYAVKPTKK